MRIIGSMAGCVARWARRVWAWIFSMSGDACFQARERRRRAPRLTGDTWRWKSMPLTRAAPGYGFESKEAQNWMTRASGGRQLLSWVTKGSNLTSEGAFRFGAKKK